MKDHEDGSKLGAPGTPTFSVNGELMPGARQEALFAAIEKALAKK